MPHTQPDVLQNNVVMMAIMEPSLPHIEQSTHSICDWPNQSINIPNYELNVPGTRDAESESGF